MTCCKDNGNCRSNPTLPINYCQWDLLYTENPGPGQHYCYCKYTAKSVQLEDLDITLAGLILLNCCTLGPAEQQAIKMLRQYKNDYLSHNTKCGITKPEYDALWPHLTNFVLQLDPSRQDDIKLLYYAEKGVTCTCQRENPDIQRQQRKSYKLGQDIFYQIHQFTTVSCINNSTVAVTLPNCDRIDIWNINNRQKVKSIQLSTPCYGITTINNKLVVGCKGRLLIIDPQTEEVERTIDTGDCTPVRLCGSGDSIFYTNESHFLYHYSHSNNEIIEVELSSQLSDVTTLQDGSVYVICYDGSVQHVSSDGKKYKQVTTKGLTSFGSVSE
ncbi:unnamed protein product [Mytilus edulis]|uniref:DZIP3-like HEPN domain-containing protein n=1 Tax=Mytilus edulis TaxID=6550 RepID=A0A8S3SMZ5_MYTED|nr:unnamed protein product [Mytilus edulis]